MFHWPAYAGIARNKQAGEKPALYFGKADLEIK
jgi:hypothetical protein